jgi:hypothetical protein
MIVLFSCLATPVLAQTTKSPDSAGQAPATGPQSAGQSAAGQNAAGQAAAASATVYPLDTFQNFSAVMVGSRAEPGEGNSKGHIYRSGKLMRMEEPGGRAYFITDLNAGETYGIMEGNCIRDEHPYIRAIPFQMAGNADAIVTRVPVGKETVDGHSCQVEDITVSSPMLANPQKMRFWEAEDLEGFPTKIEFLLPGGHGPVIRYENIVLGIQDPTLFIRPKSCQPLPQEQGASAAPQKPSTH